MKKYILIAIVILSAIVFISCEKDDSPIIEFQDENFLKALLSTNNTLVNSRYNVSVDLNGDSKISEYEASQVLAMEYDEFDDFGEFGSTDKISSMQEIKYFTSLQKLNIDNNNLTKLDLGNNAALLSISCRNNKLEELDVDECTNLTVIDCGNNKLKELNVDGCTKLTVIDCGYNNLISLNIQECNKLRNLNCTSNQIKTLNISGCSDLSVLDCSSNELISLDISKCEKLTTKYDIEDNLIEEVYISAWQVKRPIIAGYHGIEELYPDCEIIIKNE